MAKRRKKKNKSANNQPSAQPDVDVVSEHPSSTAAAAEENASESGSVTSEPVGVASTGASTSSTGFLQGTKEELEKVVWPDRQQLISESIAVFLMVSLSAFIFSFIDNLFRWVSTLVFG